MVVSNPMNATLNRRVWEETTYHRLVTLTNNLQNVPEWTTMTILEIFDLRVSTSLSITPLRLRPELFFKTLKMGWKHGLKKFDARNSKQVMPPGRRSVVCQTGSYLDG